MIPTMFITTFSQGEMYKLVVWIVVNGDNFLCLVVTLTLIEKCLQFFMPCGYLDLDRKMLNILMCICRFHTLQYI